MTGVPLVELVGITKQFGGLRALAGVDLAIPSGEVVALVGHNGAGKSVLVQILSGVFPPSSGEIRIDGQRVALQSPADARRYGIETIYQTLALADNLDAPANFFLGRELRTRLGFLDKKRMAAETARALAALNPNFVEIERPVRQMSGGQRQAIAIARAIHFRVRLLIMDEPTASLGPHETAQVGALIRKLREQGIGILPRKPRRARRHPPRRPGRRPQERRGGRHRDCRRDQRGCGDRHDHSRPQARRKRRGAGIDAWRPT